MPKKAVSSSTRMNEGLLKEIRVQKALLGLSYEKTAQISGLNPRTLENRKKNPGMFRVDELRRLWPALGLTASDLCAFFGVRYDGPQK